MNLNLDGKISATFLIIFSSFFKKKIHNLCGRNENSIGQSWLCSRFKKNSIVLITQYFNLSQYRFGFGNNSLENKTNETIDDVNRRQHALNSY